MTEGPSLASGSHCTTLLDFQRSLVDKTIKSVTISAGDATYTCEEPSKAQQMSDTFSTCTSRSACGMEQAFECNGNMWRVGYCSSPEITVGRSKICKCNGLATVRPCINNNSWGGNGGKTCNAESQNLKLEFMYI